MLRMRSGHVHEYDVIMESDRVIVMGQHGKVIAGKKVENLGQFLDTAQDLRLGWGELPDFEVIW